MKKIILSLLTLTCFSMCTPPAEKDPPPSDEARSIVEVAPEKSADQIAIEGVIGNYFEGWLTGDTTLVGSAMHSTCNLKFVRDGKVDRRNRTEYLSGFKPRPRLENAEGRIISIDITRTAAEAKIELETEKRLFTDYFNLLKEGERWYITDKVSTNIVKE